MTTDSAPAKPKKSWFKLVLFTFLCLTLAGGVVGWMLFGHYAVLFYWNGELNKALIVAKSNSEVGRTRVEQVFNDAIKAKVAPDILMRMYRVYGMSLYQEDEIDRADEQIDKAIALGEKEPPTNFAVADQLTHAWQDRATERHYHWKQDPKKPDGVKDQEMSVKVADTAFGPDHEQTVFKASGLAMMYADVGRYAEADKLIDRCIKSAETKDSARQTAWFCYAMLAHIRAVEHRYKEAVAAYFKNHEVSANNDDRGRGWDELMSGLRYKQPSENEINRLARKLLNKGDYAQLDSLAEKFIKEKTEYWDGFWKLDYLTTPLEWGQGVDATHYDQLRLDLGSWLKKNPKSAVARVALANLHINRAWVVRDEDEYGPRFYKLMKESKATLDAAPDLKEKIPFTYVPLMRLTIPDNEKDKFLKLVAEGEKRWPTYYKLDSWAVKFFSINWLGEPGEQHAFIKKRADTIGGAQGDKFYARIASYQFLNSDSERVVGKGSEYEWPRIKRGFKQIFKEYPDAVEARIAFLRLALSGDHDDDARNMEW